MANQWRDSLDNLNWDELSTLYRIAPLGDKSVENLKTAFGNSLYKCFIYDNDCLIGVGRVLADGVDCAYICDVAVHPDSQGTGLGKEIVSRLVELSQHHKKIILYAVAGKEPFYQKLGFKRMNTAMAIFQNQTLAIETGLISP